MICLCDVHKDNRNTTIASDHVTIQDMEVAFRLYLSVLNNFQGDLITEQISGLCNWFGHYEDPVYSASVVDIC